MTGGSEYFTGHRFIQRLKWIPAQYVMISALFASSLLTEWMWEIGMSIDNLSEIDNWRLC